MCVRESECVGDTDLSNLFLLESIHFARMMVAHGYFFSVEGSVPVRDDGTLFRFQVCVCVCLCVLCVCLLVLL